MGNRILKESIRSSRQINALSCFEEVVFYRLITAADDYGIYYADPVMLARTLFPLRENVDGKMMAEAVANLEAAGLIRRYSAGDEEWLQIVTWGKHQRLRNSRRTYPGPEDGETDVPEETDPGTEPDRPEQAAEVRELPVAELPLNDDSVYGVTRQQADEYAVLYPGVDVDRELCRMREWCLANRQKRKNRDDIRRFINGWLAREQNRGSPVRQLPVNEFAVMAAAAAGKENTGGGFDGWHPGGEEQ